MGCIKNTVSNVQLGTSGIAQKCRVRDWHIQDKKERNADLSLELCVSSKKTNTLRNEQPWGWVWRLDDFCSLMQCTWDLQTTACVSELTCWRKAGPAGESPGVSADSQPGPCRHLANCQTHEDGHPRSSDHQPTCQSTREASDRSISHSDWKHLTDLQKCELNKRSIV